MPSNRSSRDRNEEVLPDPRHVAAELKQQIHKGLVLHFMVQLSIGEDADERLAARKMGRVHHRLLYFAHFTPGITVSELLSVLGVKHQNIQGPLRELIAEGYILTRASAQDGRVKQLYCSRKGDKLLEFVSSAQRDRFARAYENVSARDLESYFKVMAAMLDTDRRDWASRLTAIDDSSESV
jgi:DNA-binding MarR family transcriptional regulator